MSSIQPSQERRRELRFPYSVPVTLSQPAVHSKSFQGRLENISQRGALVAVDEPLETNTQISISFHVPYQTPAIINAGQVKWSGSQTGLHLTGIEMAEENQVRMTLDQVNEVIQSLDTGEPSLSQKYDEAPVEKIRHDFAFEIYWGMLFWSFKDLLHSQLSSMTCDLSMSSFLLDQIIDKLENEDENAAGWRQYRDVANKVSAAVTNMNKFSTLFRMMQAEHPKNNNSLPEFLSLEELISERIECFKNKLSAMLIPYAGEIHFYGCNVPDLIGIRSSMRKGTDFLLLHSYQSLLYQGAKSLQIRLSEDQECIILDFVNDGSQSLHQRFMDIPADSPFPSAGLHPKDKRQVAWLVLAMHFFADHKARLLLNNESGKNVVSLRIPKSTSRGVRSADTVH